MSTSRRRFLQAAAAVAAGAASAPLAGAASAATTRKRKGSSRIERAYAARIRAAERFRSNPEVVSETNGDEARYAERWGSYSKALPHDAGGQVDAASYRAYLDAIESADMEK